LGFVREGGAFGLFQTLLTQLENYPAPVRHALMNPLSSHDIPRAITALAGESDAGASRAWQEAHHTLSSAQYARGKKLLKLAAILQYTLPGTPCLYYGDEAGLCGYRDPFNRVCHPWEKGDGELTEFFRMLGQLRRAQADILAEGEWSPVEANDAVFSFVRRGAARSLYVAVNRSDIPRRPLLPPGLRPAEAEVLLGDPNRSVLPALGALMLCYPSQNL
jgi:cyclomaltodextrinase